MTLFQRCRSEHGRHDFAVGALAAGPNVFLECEATAAHGFSGPIESWASGVLYDNVTIDGGGLLLTNREIDGQGVGWAAANSRPLAVHGARSSPAGSRPGPRTGPSAAGGSSSATGTGRRRTSSCGRTACTGSNWRSDWGAEALEEIERRAIPTEPGDARSIDDAAPRLVHEPAERPRTGQVADSPRWLARVRRQAAGRRPPRHDLVARAASCRRARRNSALGVTRFVPGRDGPRLHRRPRRADRRDARSGAGGPRTPLGPLVRPPARRPPDDPPDRRRRLAARSTSSPGRGAAEGPPGTA